MTALCGGGASAPKAGVAETIIFTAGSLSSLLNNKGGYWATLAAPLLGVLAYSATSLCSTDPPAQPTISDEEYTALLQLGPWDTLTGALVKLGDIVTRIVWFDMCECTSVATPALPTNTLTPPANVTIPTYGSGGTCPQPRARITVPDLADSTYRQSANITARLFPGMPLYQSISTGGVAPVDAGNDIILTPCGWGAFEMRGALVSGLTPNPSFGYGVVINCVGANRGVTSTLASIAPTQTNPNVSVSGTFDCVACRYLMFHHGTSSQVDGPGVIDVEIDIACSAGTTGTSDCCSDPAALALMGQLLQQVNLIQRQQVPFAYVPGATHAALTGSGELAVQGLLGARIVLDAVSQLVGEEAGVPEQIFEAGWIAWGNADGFTDREFISSVSMLSLPALAGQYTRLSYNLAVGVEATITELVREP